MRVRIIFLLKNKGGVLPFHHQQLIADWVESVFKIFWPELPKQYFPLYNFSSIKGQTKIGKKGLHYFSTRITWIFSSYKKEHVHGILNAIKEQGIWKLGGLLLEPESVLEEKPPRFSNSELGDKFMMLSPVILDEHFTETPLDLEDELFSDKVFDLTQIRMESSQLYSPHQLDDFLKFQIFPDNDYLAKVRKEKKKTARRYEIKSENYMNEPFGYLFPFNLVAEKEVKEFLFEYGVGRFTHKGFGMIDSVSEDFSLRSSLYKDFFFK